MISTLGRSPMVEGMLPVRLLLFNNLAQHCSCYFHDLENDKSLNKHNDHGCMDSRGSLTSVVISYPY